MKQVVSQLSSSLLKVYQVADGSYELEGKSVASAIDKTDSDLLEFLNSQTVQAENGASSKPIPLSLAMSYWLSEAFNGNEKAQALAQACMAEAIDRRVKD